MITDADVCADVATRPLDNGVKDGVSVTDKDTAKDELNDTTLDDLVKPGTSARVELTAPRSDQQVS